jgi:predicted dehydrogenase
LSGGTGGRLARETFDFVEGCVEHARKSRTLFGTRFDEARKHVKIYGAYEELLADDDIEAVIIALPLHLHAEAAIKAMRAVSTP